MPLIYPEKYRFQVKGYPRSAAGEPGAFRLPFRHGANRWFLNCVASNEREWEHVSVSLPGRVPSWSEMTTVKTTFWEPDDCVIQYHPPQKDYVNRCKYALHLWRPVGGGLPRPPVILV